MTRTKCEEYVRYSMTCYRCGETALVPTDWVETHSYYNYLEVICGHCTEPDVYTDRYLDWLNNTGYLDSTSEVADE